MGQRLLIVESDRRFIKDHQVALESAFEVDFVNSTETVPNRLVTGVYAAVLICVEVSENKGYALCSVLRRSPELAHIRIGLISAKATDEEYARHQSLKGRAADLYLRKPIDSSTLVTELSALVPMRGVDPDNPLGDISSADVNEEWLDGLKSDLSEGGYTPPAASTPAPAEMPVAANASQPLMVMANSAPAAGAVRAGDHALVGQLRDTVADLERKLSEKESLFLAMEMRARHAEEEARELEDRCTTLERRVNDEHKYVEHSQPNLELERSVIQLREEKRDLEAKLQAVQTRQENGDRHLNEALAIKEAAEKSVASHLAEKEELTKRFALEKADLERKLATVVGEFERVREDRKTETHSVRTRELEEERVSLQAKMEALQHRLEAKTLDVAEKAKEVESLKIDMAGLEATLRGQRRELADQGTQILSINRDYETLQATLLDQKQKQQHTEEALSQKEAALQQATEELQNVRATCRQLEDRLSKTENALQGAQKEADERVVSATAELEQRMAVAQKTQERALLDMVQEVEDRESKIRRLNVDLEAQREQLSELQQFKRSMEGDLNEKTARLEALTSAVQDLEAGIRRATDLTRPL